MIRSALTLNLMDVIKLTQEKWMDWNNRDWIQLEIQKARD